MDITFDQVSPTSTTLPTIPSCIILLSLSTACTTVSPILTPSFVPLSTVNLSNQFPGSLPVISVGINLYSVVSSNLASFSNISDFPTKFS